MRTECPGDTNDHILFVYTSIMCSLTLETLSPLSAWIYTWHTFVASQPLSQSCQSRQTVLVS